MTRDRPIKRLQICAKCAGYMQPQATFESQAANRNWKDETYHRAFGGVQVRRFVCEKCGHVQTFQVDDLGHIGEDD